MIKYEGKEFSGYPLQELLDCATPRPWVIDDRHIHPEHGMTYPRGEEPETDVILEVDTSMHDHGILKQTDKANLVLANRTVNAAEKVYAALLATGQYDRDCECDPLWTSGKCLPCMVREAMDLLNGKNEPKVD
jgi:hypothetical protein